MMAGWSVAHVGKAGGAKAAEDAGTEGVGGKPRGARPR